MSKTETVILDGEIWTRIENPRGWKNSATGMTASDAWMDAQQGATVDQEDK